MTEIGIDKDHRTVRLTSKDRSTHMQIVGASGKGKSKFMEHLIREDIINNIYTQIIIIAH